MPSFNFIGWLSAICDPFNPGNILKPNADGSINVKPTASLASTTGAETNVPATGADQVILAANTSRLGATIYNDSTAILFLLLSNATASATVYTTQLVPNDYYEVPFNYTGVIKGFYASATGNARVVEMT